MDRWRQFMKTAENDDWTLMSDAQDRKRAQNRLAQRAHRKRRPQRARLHVSAETGHSSPTALTQNGVRQAVINTAQQHEHERFPLFNEQNDGSDMTLPSPPPSRSVIIRDQRYSLMSLSALGTFRALMTNAHILRIDCSTNPRTKMIHVPSSIPTPAALTPTSLQSSQPHLPYVDLLPFTSLRDNLLRAEGMIVAHELWSDMVGGGIQVWGKIPWDTRGWEVQEYFATKWWWLMTPEVLTEANFWRVSRGEDPLILENIKSNLTRPQVSVR